MGEGKVKIYLYKNIIFSGFKLEFERSIFNDSPV